MNVSIKNTRCRSNYKAFSILITYFNLVTQAIRNLQFFHIIIHILLLLFFVYNYNKQILVDVRMFYLFIYKFFHLIFIY